MEKDFKIITDAFKVHPRHTSWDKGYIAEHDGDLYFVGDSDDGRLLTDDDCWSWTHDIERHFCFEDIDMDYYTYRHTYGSFPVITANALEDKCHVD